MHELDVRTIVNERINEAINRKFGEWGRWQNARDAALDGRLEAVVKRLMPNVGDALPTVEDLESIDLPRLTDGTVVEAEYVNGADPAAKR